MEAFRDHMRRCISLALRAEGRTEPNPMVGSVILRDGQVVAEGWHEGPGKAHAEVDAMRRLEGSARGTTVVVNLEPCCHYGRTGPCSNALIEAGVARVVVGMVDPNPLVSGKGLRQLRDAGIEVVLNVEEARCWELNRAFVERVQAGVDSGQLDPEGFTPGAFEGDGRTRFVVISAPRTGSNYLCSLLDSHPEILCHHELFNLDGIRYSLSKSEGFSLGSIAERDADPVGFVHRAWREHSGARAVGFKLARRHPEFVFRDVLADQGVRKIVLRRRNRLKTFVSELVARKEQRWTHYDASPSKLPNITVDVRLDDLRAYVQQQEAFYGRVLRVLESRGQAPIMVDYEDLFLPETQARLLGALGFEGRDLEGVRGRTPKRNPDDLRATIANYDELARELAGTEFESELCDRTPWLGSESGAPRRLRVELFVRDLDASCEFYTNVLDLRMIRRDPSDYTVLQSRDVTLGLQRFSALPSHHHLRRAEASTPFGIGVELVFEVDNLDHSFAKVASAGRPILERPQVRPWGARDFRVVDPDGYYIRVTEG
jgi:pyrimidine deaminase RibD-like protein/catechol 2,3-dioxygenase-like lactoylglutathione lyase family enzyme/LPS sulfotransferase NodH